MRKLFQLGLGRIHLAPSTSGHFGPKTHSVASWI